MRKNAVNKQLRPIDGGVCAPSGFRANGIDAGITDDGQLDFALIVADKLCPTACVYSSILPYGATATVTQKHIKNGYAQAILAHSGIANVYQTDGIAIAERISSLLEEVPLGVRAEDVVLASTGVVGKPLNILPFERSKTALVDGLEASDVASKRVAEALMTTDRECKQLSYEFDLGDVVCKIGAVFKGNARVCPNMATTLVFLTTDVNISVEMLQKALKSATNDTLNMLNVDGVSSPNDTVCIMANGKAGNYRISVQDTEYQKFLFLLKKVLENVCQKIIRDGGSKVLLAKVTGAKSKQIARTVAKSLISIFGERGKCVQAQWSAETLLYAVMSARESADLFKARVWVTLDGCKVGVFETGRLITLSESTVMRLLDADEMEICVDFGEGNYSAISFGRRER